MLKKSIRNIALGFAVATLFAGVGILSKLSHQGLQAAEPYKVGFIYIGPVGDHGWTYQHDQARKEVEKHFAGKVKTSFVENVPESGDAERVIEQLVADGNKMIFTTSFGYMNPTLKVAKRYPNVIFEHATGFKTDKNVGVYNARFYEGRYVVGQMLGKLSKTNTIGYIASFPIPEVVMGINATLLGARSVNPKMQVKVVWVNSWFDPGKEADAAKALIDQGADALMQHTDSPAAMQVAQDRKVWAVGQASDMSNFGKDAQITSIVNNWGPYYIKRIQAGIDGKWATDVTWDGLKEGMVKLAPFNAKVPKDVADAANATVEGIKSGKIVPFAGPIKNQAGKEVVAKGQALDDKAINSMDYFVEGVQGTIQK